MNTNDLNRSEFANWLDDHVAGRSTPAARTVSNSGQPDLRDAARQIHDLAGQANRAQLDPSFPATWENFMQASHSNEVLHPFPTALRSIPVSVSRPKRDRGWVKLDRVAGVLVAAALLIALSAGIWKASGGGDGPPPESTNELSALVQGTPDGQGTPSAMEPVDLPTAEDCTVEPLTVDEVLWYVTEPYVAMAIKPQPGQTLAQLQALGVPTLEYYGGTSTYASREQIEEAAATQRMWMACVLAESYFQLWALQDPYYVQQEILAVLAPLTGIDQARELLEKLEANGAPAVVDEVSVFNQFAVIGFPGGGGIQVINSNPENSWNVAPNTLVVGYARYELDGTLVSISDVFGQTENVGDNFFGAALGCDGYRFEWNDAREMWLVSWAPSCG